MKRTIALLLSGLAFAVPARAQQSPLVGVWQLSYPAGIRMENGARTVMMGKGRLTVAIEGDSLVGTLVSEPMPDAPPRPPARMSAPMGSGSRTFVARTKATLNLNGEEREATAVSTWTLTAAGDSLSGTVERRIDGFPVAAQDPQPVSGTRQS